MACFAFRFLLFLSCPLVLLSSCLASCLACFPALCLAFLALWVGCWLFSPSDGLDTKKGAHFLLPFLRCLFALILSNINPYIFRLDFHKIPPYLHILSGCGRFLLSLPACVPAALHPSNTGRCFRGLPALLG